MEEDLYKKAVEYIKTTEYASIQHIRKGLKIDYNSAEDIIERMQNEGIVSSPNKKGDRVILIKKENGESYNNPKNKEKNSALYYILAIVIGVIWAFNSNEKYRDITIDYSRVSDIKPYAIQKITQSDNKLYKENIKKMGIKTLEAGNESLQTAALYAMAFDKKCKSVELSILDASSTECNPVFSVSCNGGLLYTFLKEDIKLEIEGCENRKIKKISDSDMIAECVFSIKNKLTYPATYEAIEYNKRWIDNARFEVVIPFTAKNGFGVPVEETAVCYFIGYRMYSFNLAGM